MIQLPILTQLLDTLFGTASPRTYARSRPPWRSHQVNLTTNGVETLRWRVGISVAVLVQFGGGKRDKQYHYRPIKLPKPNGDKRQIYAPSDPLKALQRTVLHNYLQGLPLHDAATGFRQGYSVADNARRHLGQSCIATADIVDFFDNTAAYRVREFFQNQKWDKQASAILTGLCTFRGTLPQGAPTSPVLSNLVNIPLDKALLVLARQSGARYTRYGDDLTFSWASPQRMPRSMQREVQRVLLDFGYTLNRTKGWHVWQKGCGEPAYITGVILGRDGQLHPTPDVNAKMRQLRRAARDDEHAQAQLRGYEGFVRMLERER